MIELKKEIREAIYKELQDEHPWIISDIIYLVLKYIETFNSAYLDRALLQCSINGITPPRTLIYYHALVAGKRLSGLQTPTKSDVKKERKNHDRRIAFIWAFNLIHNCDALKSEAIDLACARLEKTYPNNTLINSSFEKNYDAWVKVNKDDEGMKRYDHTWLTAQKRDYLSLFPTNLPEALRGERR